MLNTSSSSSSDSALGVFDSAWGFVVLQKQDELPEIMAAVEDT